MKNNNLLHFATAFALLVALVLACDKDQTDQLTPLKVNGLSVTMGGAGQTFAITGTGFNVSPNKNTVDIGPNKALAIAANTTKMVVQLPTEDLQPGTWVVTVTANGQTASSTQEFTVLIPEEDPPPQPAPVITQLDLSEGVPGSQVTLNGEHFGTEPSVLVNNVEAVDVSVNESGTQLTFTVPATTTGTISVSVQTNEGTLTTSTETEFVVPQPSISTFAPNTGPPGTAVVLTVVNYSSVNDYNTVEVAGPNGSRIAVEHQLNTETNEMTITLPEEVRDGTISLTVGAQTAHTETDFTVLPPTISDFAPKTGHPGDEVVLTVANYSPVDDYNTVEVAGPNGSRIAVEHQLNTETNEMTITLPEGVRDGTLSLTVGAQTAHTETEFDVPAWRPRADFPEEVGTYGVVSAVLNDNGVDKIFVTLGINNYETYAFNPNTNSWEEKSPFPTADENKHGAFSFAIDNRWYIGGGASYEDYDLYVYNPENNAWTTLENSLGDFIPDGDRLRYASTFTHNGKGYVYGGTSNDDPMGDLHQFDPETETWNSMQPLDPDGRAYAVAFEINGLGYVTTGLGDDYKEDLQIYDPIQNTWSNGIAYPGNMVYQGTGFVVNERVFVGTGTAENFEYQNELWEYEPTIGVWTKKADVPGLPRYQAFSQGLGNHGYVGLGDSSSESPIPDFWQYTPENDNNN